MQVDGNDFPHAIFNHLRCEKVGLPFPVDSDLPHVLQKMGGDGHSRARHVDFAVVANHLGHIRQGTAVVKVKVAEKRKSGEKSYSFFFQVFDFASNSNYI